MMLRLTAAELGAFGDCASTKGLRFSSLFMPRATMTTSVTLFSTDGFETHH